MLFRAQAMPPLTMGCCCSDSLYVPTSAIVEAEQLLAQECVQEMSAYHLLKVDSSVCTLRRGQVQQVCDLWEFFRRWFV